MKFSDRVKTYNFWVSIASAIFLIINLIGKRFNFTIDESVYDDIFTTFCSVLVLLGIIVPPTNLKGQIYFTKMTVKTRKKLKLKMKIKNQSQKKILIKKKKISKYFIDTLVSEMWLSNLTKM